MDTAEMARHIRVYTNGYPFLVSRLCQLMDTQVSSQMESRAEAWIKKGFEEALKLILDNRIFETRLYNLFLSDDELKSNVLVSESNLARNQFVKDGRQLFLLYLKPIISGTGNVWII